MYKKIGFILSLILTTSFLGFNNEQFYGAINIIDDTEELRLVLDTKNIDSLPQNFRKTNNKVTIPENETVDLNGLDTLNASGSAEFSEIGIKLIKESIGDDFNIVDIDLREESHGFINGMPVSWTNNYNNPNKGLTKKQVIENENDKLKSIVLGEPITFYNNNKETVIAEKVESEKQLVNRNGIKYLRLPITDNERPSDEIVDEFIEFVTKMPSQTWLHFHCKYGLGRTTTFLTMYDIMRNSKNVALEDIMKRQILIGGQNLLVNDDTIDNEQNSTKQRSLFIRNFYNYSKENKDNFKTKWSQWIKNNNLSKSA